MLEFKEEDDKDGARGEGGRNLPYEERVKSKGFSFSRCQIVKPGLFWVEEEMLEYIDEDNKDDAVDETLAYENRGKIKGFSLS